MAIYVFQCKNKGCQKVIDVKAPMRLMPKAEDIKCPNCGGETKKLVTIPNLPNMDSNGSSRW